MLSRLTLLVALLAATILLPISDASAERRVAMVIGNSEYAHASTLRNPRNDASDIAETLKKLGFEVLVGVDLDQQRFARTVEQFARMLDDADVGLFFYAGHGVQINEKNYLVSTNAKLASEFLVSAETMELDAIVRLMESKAATNLVFLDACRNNPLAEDLRKNLAALKRSAVLGRGLARVEPTGRDTLIAFAAAPGQEAGDGGERNSPFTKSLLKHIPTPGLEVSVMLKEVAADVRRDTSNSQRPQQLSDMSRVFYFAKAEPPVTVAAHVETSAKVDAAKSTLPGVDDRALDVAFWNASQSANDCDAVKAYMQRFPNGIFVELARLSERRLCPGRKIDVVTAPPAASSDAATKPIALASLPEPSVGARPASSAAAVALGPDLARAAQLELVRLGCSADADGKWGASSKTALRLFNKHAKAKLNADEPSETMVMALRKRDGRVCPLQCEQGFRARGNTCVAAKSEPKRSTRKVEARQERRRAPARVVHEEVAPVQHQPSAVAAPVGLMMMYGAGRFRFR